MSRVLILLAMLFAIAGGSSLAAVGAAEASVAPIGMHLVAPCPNAAEQGSRSCEERGLIEALGKGLPQIWSDRRSRRGDDRVRERARSAPDPGPPKAA